MKIIFLDIDNVLNSDDYMATPEYQAETAPYKSGWEILNKAHHTHLDPKAVQLMNRLVDETGAKVVLSSTWRIRYSLEEMNAMLKSRGATFEVSDKTPAKMSSRHRGYEVAEYLEDLKELEGIEPEAFVILDDLDQFPQYRQQFIMTLEKNGLTQEHVDKAIKILNGELDV